jgi:hypothetical protein
MMLFVLLFLCCCGCSCVKRKGSVVDVEGEIEFIGLRIMKKMNIKGMKMMKMLLVTMKIS